MEEGQLMMNASLNRGLTPSCLTVDERAVVFGIMPLCSFSEALNFKYGEDLENKFSGPCEIFVVGSFPGRSSPSGRLVLPRIITLNCSNINKAGVQQTIEELCHNTEELDIAQNQLNDLNEINNIICHMPNLGFLNLSHNVMKNTKPADMTKMESVHSLVLNHTYVSLLVVSCFLDAMPNIQELHLSLNDYSSIDIALNKQYPNLKQLFVCGNPLSSWEDIICIGKVFPQLEVLVMADTHIPTVPDPVTWSTAFPNLRSLNFNNALITDWTDIDRLNSFQKLEDIRLQGLPLLEEFSELERRQHLIARLPCAARLNGSVILQKEREDAERAFIRYCLPKHERPKRFYDLEAVHGKLTPLVDIDLSPRKTARVEVHYSERQLTWEINLQHSVQDFKSQLSNMFGVRRTRMRLFYVDRELKEVQGPEELKFNGKKLYTYNIRDGDEFLVDVK